MKEYFKKQSYITIGIVTLIVLLVGTTFAWFNYTSSQNNNGTIVTSGTLAISYQDGTIIEADKLVPADEPVYNASCDNNLCYKNAFTVSNNGSLDAYVTGQLKIENNTFESNKLMYKIMDGNTVVMASSGIPTTNSVTLFEGLTLTGTSGTKTYTLFIWLNNSATNASQGKTMTGTIELNAVQTGVEYVALDGILYDSNNNILANTDIELHSNTKYATTDENGYFNFGLVETGTHTIIAKTNEETTILNDTITIIKGNETTITNKTIQTNESIKINIIPTSNGLINKIEEFVEENSILASGMIPVKYNGTTLVKADETNNDNSWYNYDSKMWANAVLVTSGTRDTYMNASVGTAITESDVLAYYVWIPRYKYKLWNTAFTTSSPQEIDIVFENTTDPISNGTTNGQYLSHPAFWWDNNSNGIRETGEELAGIWVGKFETSTDVACTATTGSVGTACDLTTLNPRILPNVISWRGARVSTFFSGIKKIESTTYINNPTEIDSHMMKNMEWGAVAYLSYSKYGKNAELEINESYLTGDGAYKTNILQSTTGNITGVYDMSGGAYEFMMGVQQDNTGTNTPMSGYSTAYNSGFTGKLYDNTQYSGTAFPAKKYYDLYTYGTTYNDQTAYNRSHLGDATGETRSWNSDDANFVSAERPWFLRGGRCNFGSRAGAFAFVYYLGYANTDYGVRGVLLANVSEPLNN